MPGSESWIYQGRQYHQWFGHGTKPKDGQASETTSLGDLDARIASLSRMAFAGMPASKQRHWATSFDAAATAQLVQTMRAWVAALRLSPTRFADLVGLSEKHPALPHFREAARLVGGAESYADMRGATDQLAAGMMAVGLDYWQRFLAAADERARDSGLGRVMNSAASRTSGATPPAGATPSAVAGAAAPSRNPKDTAAERGALADRLMRKGVQATAEDMAVVRRFIVDHVPVDALRLMARYGVTIVVTRDAVVTEKPELAKQDARGWAPSMMEKVPGIYYPPTREAIIATKSNEDGSRRMADDREEGSIDMVAHEAGHGINWNASMWGKLSDKADFIEAYKQDGQKGVFAARYYHQENDGPAGRDEAWAEGFAMYNSDPDRMQKEYPHMYAYFKNFMASESK